MRPPYALCFRGASQRRSVVFSRRTHIFCIKNINMLWSLREISGFSQ